MGHCQYCGGGIAGGIWHGDGGVGSSGIVIRVEGAGGLVLVLEVDHYVVIVVCGGGFVVGVGIVGVAFAMVVQSRIAEASHGRRMKQVCMCIRVVVMIEVITCPHDELIQYVKVDIVIVIVAVSSSLAFVMRFQDACHEVIVKFHGISFGWMLDDGQSSWSGSSGIEVKVGMIMLLLLWLLLHLLLHC